MNRPFPIQPLLIALFLSFLLSVQGNGQEPSAEKKSWRLGFRVGDPTGFQLQRILGQTRLEVHLGRYFNFDRFDYSKWIYKEEPALLSENDRLEKYQINRSYLLQVNLAHAIPLDSANGIHFYYGGGLQLRSMYIEYRYRVISSGRPVNRELQRQDYGFNGLVGVENEWKEQPLSVYLDGGIFLALNNEFRPWLQFGLGIRYHFR